MKREDETESMIEQEELLLRKQFGHTDPFRVPDGFFDSIADQIIEQLPEKKAEVIPMKTAARRFLRPWMGVAACLAVVVLLALSAGMWKHEQNHENMVTAAKTYATQGDSDIDVITDYTMMDNEDIYAYVSGY